MTNRKIYNLSEDRFYNNFLKSQLAEYMFSALESEIYILHFYSGLEAIEICLALDLSNLEFEMIRDQIFLKLNVPNIKDKTAHLRKFITNRYIEFSKNENTNIKYNNYSREKKCTSISDCLVKKNDDSKTLLSFNSLGKHKCHTSLSIEGFFEELNPAVETMNYEKFKELFNRVDFPDSLISEAIQDACNANEKVVCIRENKHTRLSLIVWNPEFKTSPHTHAYYYDAIWVVKGIVTQISFNGSAENIQHYKSGSKIVLPFPIKHMLLNNTNQIAVTVNVQHSPVSELKPLSFPIHSLFCISLRHDRKTHNVLAISH